MVNAAIFVEAIFKHNKVFCDYNSGKTFEYINLLEF